jgi:hypothetical protein
LPCSFQRVTRVSGNFTASVANAPYHPYQAGARVSGEFLKLVNDAKFCPGIALFGAQQEDHLLALQLPYDRG